MNILKIESGSLHGTKQYGRLSVIEYINNQEVKVKFEKTGYETTCTKQSLLMGRVADRWAPHRLYVRDVKETLHLGLKFEVVKIFYDDTIPMKSVQVKIKFLETGYTKLVPSAIVATGKIQDPLHRTVHGVGYLGIGMHKAQIKRKKTISNQRWASMIQRCYTDNKKCYSDVSVCEDWHNFQNYADWFEDNFEPNCVVDKDLKSWGSKVYSPTTCAFIPLDTNSRYTKSNYDFPLGTNVLKLTVAERELYRRTK